MHQAAYSVKVEKVQIFGKRGSNDVLRELLGKDDAEKSHSEGQAY